MNLQELLRKIASDTRIQLVEERTFADGTKLYIFCDYLPFPRAQDPVWYNLVLSKDQTEVERPEIESMLRHFWEYQVDWFDDPAEDELVPL